MVSRRRRAASPAATEFDLDSLLQSVNDTCADLSDGLESTDPQAKERIEQSLDRISESNFIQQLQDQIEEGYERARKEFEKLVDLLRRASQRGSSAAKDLLSKLDLEEGRDI